MHVTEEYVCRHAGMLQAENPWSVCTWHQMHKEIHHFTCQELQSFCHSFILQQEWPSLTHFLQEVIGYGLWNGCIHLRPPHSSQSHHIAKVLPSVPPTLFHRYLAISHLQDLLQMQFCLHGGDSHFTKATPIPFLS